MLTVQLQGGPDALLAPLRHHAKNLEPIALELIARITLTLAPSPTSCWLIRQSKTGANSFSLVSGTDQYHFRGDVSGNCINVYRNYQRGTSKPFAQLKTRLEAKKFVESLKV